jgi:recombination protein RecA
VRLSELPPPPTSIQNPDALPVSAFTAPAAIAVDRAANTHLLQPGRFVEISGGPRHACTTAAVTILREAQGLGETAAWIQYRDGTLYPPDLADSGIELPALVVVRIPEGGGAAAACRAAELLLRSGGLGLVVLDLRGRAPRTHDTTWQRRLHGLVRQHQSCLLVLTDKAEHEDSLGPLVGLRVAPRRERVGLGRFEVTWAALKNKSSAPWPTQRHEARGPWGLG